MTPRPSPISSAEAASEKVPRLENGDRLTRDEFERRYDAMPDLKKAELIEGVVYLPSPVGFEHHSRPHRHLSTWLGRYEASTPGVEGGDNASVRLELDNEPQPDAFLRIAPDRGGQSRTSKDDIVEGAPDLVAEVSSSTVSFDLGRKLEVYRRNGVLEYLVWRVNDRAIDWFILERGEYLRLPLDRSGNYRSQVFPGLWLDPDAITRGKLQETLAVLEKGLQAPEHLAFVERLEKAKKKS